MGSRPGHPIPRRVVPNLGPVGLALLAIGLGSPVSLTKAAQDGKATPKVGDQVVQKPQFKLLDKDGGVQRNLGQLDVYRVEGIEGDRLHLHAPGLDGYASADDVVATDRAIEFYSDAIKENPTDASLYTMRGTIHHRITKDLDAALADYDKAVSLAPAASHLYNNRGNIWYAKRDYDRALTEYGEALRLSPGDVIASNNRGRVWVAKRQYPRALEDFNVAVENGPTYAQALVNRADTYRAMKDEVKATADYDAAIKIDPKYVPAWLGRSQARIARDDFAGALADCDEAVRVAPRLPGPYVGRSQARVARKDYDGAVADCDRAIALDPKVPFAFTSRGRAHRLMGRLDLALADDTEAIRLAPKNPSLFNSRGTVWQAKKDYARARDDFSEAIRLDPKVEIAYRNRAVVALAGTGEGGEADARKAITCSGWWTDSALYAVLIGHFAARRAGDEPGARTLLDDAFKNGDDAAWPYQIVRHLRREIDEPALLALAVDVDKKTEAHCYLGLQLLFAGRPDAARDHFRWARDQGNESFMEHAIAVAELDRLDAASPPKP